MSHRLSLLALLAIACTTLLVACGDKKAETTTAAEAESGSGTITCEGPAMSGDAGLPAQFPVLPELTLVTAEDKGPTHVVDGYAEDGIDGVYNEQYTILFNEIEKERGDAEISYQTPDKKTSGQIALRASCDNGNTSVHITARPA
jgi:hypothetical protein